MEEQRAHELVQLEGHTPHTYLRTLNFTLGGARYRETDENDVFKSSEYLHKLYGYISDPDSVSKVYGSPFNFAEHDVQKALAWQRKLDPISVTETRLKLMVRFMEDDDFKPPVEWLPLFLIVTSRYVDVFTPHANFLADTYVNFLG